MSVIVRGLNPWVLIFVGLAFFHLWRQSPQDIIIFGGSALLILTQVFGKTSWGFAQQPQIKPLPIALVVLGASAALYVSERHGAVNFLVLVVFIPIGFVLLFYRDSAVHPVPKRQVLRSRWVWTLWAGLFALVELVAYLGSKLSGDLERYPTISVLLDPILDEPIGRAVFIALWLVSGIYLFGVRRPK